MIEHVKRGRLVQLYWARRRHEEIARLQLTVAIPKSSRMRLNRSRDDTKSPNLEESTNDLWHAYLFAS